MTKIKVTPYPLCWPVGWQRTADPRRSKAPFRVSMRSARDHLVEQIAKLQGVPDYHADMILSSNIPVRLDGLPHANHRQPDDPGVAVYFRRGERDLVMACDRFTAVAGNMRAVGLTIQAIRAIDRYGASDMLERAFTGFTALPAEGETHEPPWWQVLEWTEQPSDVPPELLLRIARMRYRALLQQLHPDRGGTHEQMARLNRAWAAAKLELE